MENSDQFHQVQEGIPISKPTYSRLFQAQIGRGVVVWNTLVSSEHSSGSLEEECEIGSRVWTEGEEGMTNIVVIEGEEKFKVTWGSTDSGGGDTSLN